MRYLVLALFLLSGCPALSVDLGMNYQHQGRYQWCWAACDAMILEYFQGEEVLQSDIVAEVFGAPYDYAAGVGAGLRDLHDKITDGQVSERTLKSAIEQGHPLVLGYSDADSSHFRIVEGYDPDGFTVYDPNLGISHETYSELIESEGRVWDETHEITRAPFEQSE